MKRIISLTLCLCLLAGLLPVTALAEDAAVCAHEWAAATCVTPETCMLCGETRGEVSADTCHQGLIELTGDGISLLADGVSIGGECLKGGNYYLGEDVTLAYEHYLEGDVNICLNGYALMFDSDYDGALVNYAALRVYDCGDTQRHFSADENGLWVLDEDGEFTVTGGVITGGIGYRGEGGAVLCDGGRFELHGGNIVGNSAELGGGVYVGDGGSFLMTGGRIAGNVASGTDGLGGGVYCEDGAVTVTGGSIDHNRATSGSGIYQAYGSGEGRVTLSGGTVTDNTASGGFAVYITTALSLSGAPVIDGNTGDPNLGPNLYMSDTIPVDVSGGLEAGASVGLWSEKAGVFTTGGGGDYVRNFKSDNPTYYVVISEGELALSPEPMCEEHTPDEAVTENEVDSTCEAAGSYDTVVYCAVCGEEISRETTALPLADHDWGQVTADFERTCGVCFETKTVDSISGVTTDGLEWVLTKDGVLTISGEGECTELEELEEYDIKAVIVEEGITALGRKAIKMLASVTSLSLPKTMEDLDADAINRYMEGISSITVAAGNKEYTVQDGMLFNRKMTELLCAPRCGIDETVTVPEGVKVIDGYAFANSWVSALSLPISLESVNACAFDGCDELETVAYPGTEAAWTAMVTVKSGNTALKDADFTYGTVDRLSGTCGDDAAWVLTLSDGLLTISGSGVIEDQSWPRDSVTEVVVEEGITAIGEDVFCKHSNLTKITLPASLTAVDDGAFSNSGLETVIYNGSEPQWGLVDIGADNDELLEAGITFDSRLVVEWNSAHTVLSISGMIRDSAWVTAAFYEADGRMAFVKYYAAADVQSGVGIGSTTADLTVCTAKVMVLDENYAPMGLPYSLGAGTGGSGTVTAWLYATEHAYIDGSKKAEADTLLFSDGTDTYVMETGKGTPGTWDLGQSYDLTLGANGEVTAAALSGVSEADECFLLHVNVEQTAADPDITFEFGELTGTFADGEIPCLVLEPGCSGVPGTMTAEDMADMAETRVSHLYRGVDKDGDGEIDYLLVKPTLYGLVYKAVKDFVLLEDNQGEKMTETVSGDTAWYLEDMLDIEDLPAVGSILKLTWNIDTGLYEVEDLEERRGELTSLSSRNLRFDFGVVYVADDGWVDVDDMDEEITYKVLMDEKLLVWAEEMAVDYADATQMYADGADIDDKAKDAVELVTLLDLMAGYVDDDGSVSFRPDNTVTRAQTAKLVYGVLNYGEKDDSDDYVDEDLFTDVAADAWYAGYVGYCGENGLVPVGGTFRPNDIITCAEACRMLLCAAEYDLSNYLDEDWESSVLSDAASTGLLDGYLYAVNTVVPRQWMAKLLENFLTKMTVTDGTEEVTPGEKYLELTESSPIWKQVYGSAETETVETGWLYVTQVSTKTAEGYTCTATLSSGEQVSFSVTGDAPVTNVLYAYEYDAQDDGYALTLVRPGEQNGEIVDLHNDRGVELEDADTTYLSMEGVTVALLRIERITQGIVLNGTEFWDLDDLNDTDIANDREADIGIQYTDYYYEAGKLLYVLVYEVSDAMLEKDSTIPEHLETIFYELTGVEY